MKKIPITLEQYECPECKLKWYINTQDKVANEMACPYGCAGKGVITRKFEMMIHDYKEYVQGTLSEAKDIVPTLDDEIKHKGGKI